MTLERKSRDIRMNRKGFVSAVLSALIVSLVGGCSAFVNESTQPTLVPASTPTATPNPTPGARPDASVEYRNTQYGFSFVLPESWKGYTIDVGEWGGDDPERSDVTVELGPEISIRHPQSMSEKRRDIPIMVFTLAQWQSLQAGAFRILAGKINPTELGRNSRYVFALAARDSYPLLEGVEEVEQILQSHPLRTFEPAGLIYSPAQYEITEKDSGKTFVYSINTKFRVVLDRERYPRENLKWTCDGDAGWNLVGLADVQPASPSLYSERYMAVGLGRCTLTNGDFSVTIEMKEAPPGSTPAATLTPQSPASVEYRNPEYGLSFELPDRWRGYTIVVDEWKGDALGPRGEVVLGVEQGPMISIRHPRWISENPRQDIPIMVFTLAQWNSLQEGKFHIGAAPINPSELGRNSRYVFALPARYNYAFPEGFEEVQQILQGHPLRTLEPEHASTASQKASPVAAPTPAIYTPIPADALRRLNPAVAEGLLSFLDARRRGDKDLMDRLLTSSAQDERSQPGYAWLLPSHLRLASYEILEVYPGGEVGKFEARVRWRYAEEGAAGESGFFTERISLGKQGENDHYLVEGVSQPAGFIHDLTRSDGSALLRELAIRRPDIRPVLQPRYLPPELNAFHLQPSGSCFSIAYARAFSFPFPDSPSQELPYLSLVAGGFNPQHGGPPREVVVRGISATVSGWDDSSGHGRAVGLIWREPGKWVMDGGARLLPEVLYGIQSLGVSEEEVLRVAESLVSVDGGK